MWKRSLALAFIIPAAVIVVGNTESRETPALTRAEPGEQANRPALRTKEDLARGRRWELGWGVASAYDTATGGRVRTVRLPGATLSAAPETCVPDMLLSRTGALVVSSNAQPSLWRISPAHFEVERFDIELDSDQDKDFGFTGLAWGADEKVVYAVSAVMGTLWRIDMSSATAKRVELSSPVHGACGLSASSEPRYGRHAPDLLVAIGARAAAARVSLSPDLARGEVAREQQTVAGQAREP